MVLFLDGDSCPVRNEAYRVALRYAWRVYVVAKAPLKVPNDPLIELVVQQQFGEVDHWIAAHAGDGHIVVTADVGLAARCLARGALVLSPRGQPFQSLGIVTNAIRRRQQPTRRTARRLVGQPPLTRTDRSRFLAKLDQTIHQAKRTIPTHAA